MKMVKGLGGRGNVSIQRFLGILSIREKVWSRVKGADFETWLSGGGGMNYPGLEGTIKKPMKRAMF